MNEKQTQNKILKFLKKEEVFAYKHIVTNINGIPDIVFLKGGIVIWVEVKGPKGVVSFLQKYQMDRILNGGGKAFVVRSFEEFLEIYKDL